MVNLVDVLPTLLRLQGLDVLGPCTPALPTATDAAPRDAAFSEYGAGGPRFGMEDLATLPQPYGRRALIRSLQWREAEDGARWSAKKLEVRARSHGRQR